MTTIYKYPFAVRYLTEQDFVIDMPAGAEVLSVQVQGDSVCLWAMVDTEAAAEVRRFRMFGTGHPLPRDAAGRLRFVGTVQDGWYVGHLFEDVGK
jgi:hypothetical protein